MPGLVRRDADGRRCRGVVDVGRQADDVRARVVMVGQLAGDALDAHAADAVCREHGARGIRAGHAAAVVDLRIAAEGRAHLNARPDGEQHRKQDRNIIPVKIITVAEIHGRFLLIAF